MTNPDELFLTMINQEKQLELCRQDLCGGDLQRLFEEMDLSKQGYLDTTDIYSYFSKLDAGVTLKQAYSLLKYWDKDADGRVGLDE